MLNKAEETPKDGGRCDLCGTAVMIVNDVRDDLGSYSICAGCAELWTTYLMHHPRLRRQSGGEVRYPRTEFEAD